MTDEEQWLERWRSQGREGLTERFKAAGAADPASWATSEADEDFAQFARFAFMRGVWEQMRESVQEAVQEVPDPADPTALREWLQRAVYTVTINVLYTLGAPDVPPDSPGWALMETTPDGVPTGRDLGGLHEDFLDADPLQQEGEGWL